MKNRIETIVKLRKNLSKIYELEDQLDALITETMGVYSEMETDSEGEIINNNYNNALDTISEKVDNVNFEMVQLSPAKAEIEKLLQQMEEGL